MSITRKIIVSLFFCFSNLCLCQWTEAVDSLIRTADDLPNDSLKVARYGTLFEKLMFTDSKRALKYATLENELANRLNYKKGIAASNLHFGTYHENIGQVDSARMYYIVSKDKFKLINSLRGELFINHALASLERKLGNYDKALAYFERNIEIYNSPNYDQSDLKGFNKIGAEYIGIAEIQKDKGNYSIAVQQALKALRFFEEIEHTRRIGNSLRELGDIEQKRKNYKSALEYGIKAYQIFKDHDYNEYRSLSAIDIGRSYFALKKYDQAKTYFNDALETGRQFKFVDAEATALINLGMVNRAAKNFSSARNFLNQGIQLHRELNFKNELAKDLNELANLELEVGNTEQAIKLINEAIQISNNLKSLNILSESYQIRSMAYERLNRHNFALQDYKNYKKLTDSIFNTTKFRQIEELRTIYDTEKKEQQIAFQEKEITVLEQNAEISTLQKILLGGLLLLSLIGFYGVRQKLKRNKLEKEKIDAELAFKKKELTTHALQLAKKNETLEGLKQKAKELKTAEKGGAGYQQLIRTINFDLQNDNNWKNFAKYFEEVHKDFSSNVKTKYPEVTPNELRLMALLKMNLSSKEIANILNISQEGIKKARYRLRKKLNITTEDSLQDLVLSL